MSEDPSGRKRVTPANLLVALSAIFVIQFFGLLITRQNAPAYSEIVNTTGYSYNPLGSTAPGAAGNAVLLVGLAFALTLALVWLLRRKMVKSFKVVIFGSLSIAAFYLTLLTADVFAVYQLPPSLELPFAVGAAVLVVALIGYTIFVKNRVWLSTLVLAFVGAEVGSFFAETLPPYTAIALPIAFSVYDIYAVFRGPLKHLIGTAPNLALVGMSVKAGEFTLGLGDIVFYTMLPAIALFRFGRDASIGTLLAVDLGVVVTLFLLSRKRLLPGLPIPMTLGVAVLLAYLV
jgi:hypothetical protein